MDIEKVTHGSFRRNVFAVVLVSLVIVGTAATLGRGIIKIKGSLTSEQPTDLTVAVLLEPYDLFPQEVFSLPQRADGEWRYSIRMKSGDVYFVRVAADGPPWKLVNKPELLRPSDSAGF